MKQVGILEAKTHLSGLVSEVEAGEDVVITRHGRPVARLVRAAPERTAGPETAEQIRAVRAEIERRFGVDETFDWKAAVSEGRR